MGNATLDSSRGKQTQGHCDPTEMHRQFLSEMKVLLPSECRNSERLKKSEIPNKVPQNDEMVQNMPCAVFFVAEVVVSSKFHSAGRIA